MFPTEPPPRGTQKPGGCWPLPLEWDWSEMEDLTGNSSHGGLVPMKDTPPPPRVSDHMFWRPPRPLTPPHPARGVALTGLSVFYS